MKLFLDESGTKSQNIPPISDHTHTGKDRFPKNYNICAFLPIVASRRNAPLEKNPQFFTIFALVKYREYRVIIVLKPQISCNIVWTFKKKYRSWVILATVKTIWKRPDRTRSHESGWCQRRTTEGGPVMRQTLLVFAPKNTRVFDPF